MREAFPDIFFVFVCGKDCDVLERLVGLAKILKTGVTSKGPL